MEYIEVLCCCKMDSEHTTIQQLIVDIKKTLGIEFYNKSGVCLADFTQEDIDEEDQSYYEPLEYSADFEYKEQKCKIELERITKWQKRVLDIKVSYLADDNIDQLDSSVWYELKEKILFMLNGKYTTLFWFRDTQSKKMAANIYSGFHDLENYLREVIDKYMVIRHGGNWFERYSYEEFRKKYENYSEWFTHSRYHLFKLVDNHLSNIEMSDIFEVLKTAKKKQLSKNTQDALKKIVNQEKEKASEIAKVDMLDAPSLWDEEGFEDIFNQTFVKRWENDLSKRRNMIAHNKTICRDFYIDTLRMIKEYNTKISEAESILMCGLKSDETIMEENLRNNDEIALKLEYCGINPDLPDDEAIIEKLNEQDDFIDLSGMISDRLERIPDYINDILGYLDDAESALHADNFFENELFTGRELLEEYIEFSSECELYSTWKKLLDTGISLDIYNMIEPVIYKYIQTLRQSLEKMRESIFFVDLQCLSEGSIIRIEDLDGNKYTIDLKGWFCQERGSWNELYVDWMCNGEILERGGIYIAYGDYEMSGDNIPLPSVEDELSTKFKSVNNAFDNLLDKIHERLSAIEDNVLKIEF